MQQVINPIDILKPSKNNLAFFYRIWKDDDNYAIKRSSGPKTRKYIKSASTDLLTCTGIKNGQPLGESD
jgi:hypothetical protein